MVGCLNGNGGYGDLTNHNYILEWKKSERGERRLDKEWDKQVKMIVKIGEEEC